MRTILRIDCSPKGSASNSRRLADVLMQRLTASSPMASIIRRDLAAEPPRIVDAAFAAAMIPHQTAESARDVAALRLSEELIGELEASDALVLSTPMHNFTVPVVLKAWLDQVVRFGRTFRSTPEGKIGLLRDRPVFIVVSSGSDISGPRARQPDFLTPYMVAILRTIGIFDVTFFRLEGMSREAEAGYQRGLDQLDADPRLPRLAAVAE
jgi:FMN-dependent NADH-azoreductase